MYFGNMAQLDKDDLAQMNEDYFKSLKNERLVEVAKNLHQLATELWEKQQQNSENSSQPPSSDNPYSSNPTTEEKSQSPESELSQEKTKRTKVLTSFKEKVTKTPKERQGNNQGLQGSGVTNP